MFKKEKSTNSNRFIVFDIEDNLAENIKGFNEKKEARKHFEQRLINRDVSRKDITEALKTSIYMESDFSINLIDIG